MSIDLFLDDGRFHPPSNYDRFHSRKIFPKETTFLDPKSDPRNYEVNHPYHPEIEEFENDKIECSYDIIDEILDLLDNDDIHNDELDIINKQLCSIKERLQKCQTSIKEDINEDFEEFQPGKLLLADKNIVKISKEQAKRLNKTLKGSKYGDKLYKDATQSKQDFKDFLEFSKLNEDVFDDKISKFADPSNSNDFTRTAAQTIKYGALAGKAFGAASAGLVAVPYASYITGKNIYNAYKYGKYYQDEDRERRAYDKEHQKRRKNEEEEISPKSSQSSLIERFLNR